MRTPDAPPPAANPKRWLLAALRIVVVAAVVWFVSQTVRDAWAELSARELTLRPLPAVLAGLMIVVAQSPMAWFWRRTLVALAQPAPLWPAVSAYYLSQIGKYVPGKASVVLIRTERLLEAVRRGGHAADSQAVCARTVAAAVFYETLTHIAIGSLLGAVLTATVAEGDASTQRGLIALSVGLAAVCLTPTLPPVFAWLLQKVARAREGEVRRERRQLSYGLSALGAACAAVSWLLIGVVVWLAAVSVGAAGVADLARLPLWVLAAALPTVAGFVSLLPAGLLVREALTLLILAPTLGEADALAVTIAVRMVWVITELCVCGSLLVGSAARRARRPERLPS